MNGLRASVAVTLALALTGGVVAWAVGVTWYQSLLVAAVVVTLGAGNALVASVTDHTLPARFAERRQGTRREVTWLSGTLTGRRGAASPRAVARVRALARQRLARRGLDPHDPRHAAAAQDLLGPGAYAVVIADPDRPVRYLALVRCVAALEHLDDRPAAGAAPVAR